MMRNGRFLAFFLQAEADAKKDGMVQKLLNKILRPMNAQAVTTRSSANRFGRALQKTRNTNASSTATSQVPAKKAQPSGLDANGGQSDARTESGPAFAGTWERSEMRGNGNGTEVVFLMDINLAKEVLLVGDFTDWQNRPIKLQRGVGGTWHTKVKLEPGRHLYRFLVDGQWHDDPNHAYRVANPFGTFDNVIEIS
jgi:hypothetical protein